MFGGRGGGGGVGNRENICQQMGARCGIIVA